MKSLLLGSLLGLLLPLAGVSLVAPLLSDGLVGVDLLESFQLDLADGSDTLDEGGESIENWGVDNGLLFLNGEGGTLGVSLMMPFLALVTNFFSCLGKRTSLLR